MTVNHRMRKRLHGLRPFLVVFVSMGLVMTTILIGARLSGRDFTYRYPEGFPLDYAGAPANYFVPLFETAISAGGLDPSSVGASVGASFGGSGSPLKASNDGHCGDETRIWDPVVPCESESESATYVATQELKAYGENDPISIGGQHFDTDSPVRAVRVIDENGPGVSVRVCQFYRDHGRGDVCLGRQGDVVVEFCSTEGPRDLSQEGFRPGYFDVDVDTNTSRCPTTATVGTITVTW